MADSGSERFMSFCEKCQHFHTFYTQPSDLTWNPPFFSFSGFSEPLARSLSSAALILLELFFFGSEKPEKENPEDKKALDAAAQQGIDWFKKHLS